MKTTTKFTLILFIVLLVSAIYFPIKQSNAYNFNWKEYNIEIPTNINYIEHCYFTRQCELSKKQKALVKLNILLIKKGYNPLYK